jgi:hypothetical protein
MHRRVLLLVFALMAAACSPNLLSSAERPGLGTTWGESRDSPVHWVRFVRADATRPLAVARLHYDDAAGVSAMAADERPIPADDGVRVAGGALRVRVLDDSGAPFLTFASGERQYVMGRDGARYLIEVVNDTDERIEAVATVDGLDAMDGRRGSLAKRGYVIEPWSAYRITGFRRNEAEVAAFRFGAVADSYAARTGDDANVGVIGVAFFAERGARAQWPDQEAARRHRADPFPGRFASPPP